MNVKISYKKELYSLPSDIVEMLRSYAARTDRKKSHIVAEAIQEYIQRHNRKRLSNEAKEMFGIISADTPDIQEIKARR